MRGRSPRPLDDGGIFSFSTGCEANRATSDKYTQVFILAQLTACRAEFQRFHATALASTRMAYTRRRARPSHYGILEANPSSRTQGAYLFLDEVQEAEQWQGFCQRLAEHERVTLVVTVSSSKLSSEQAFLCYELNEYTTSLKPDTTAVPKSLCGRSGTGLRRFTRQSTGCRQTIGNRSLSRIASTSIRQTHRFHYLADLAHL